MVTKVNKKSLSVKDSVCVSVRSRSHFRVRVNGEEMLLLPNDLITLRPACDALFFCLVELLGEVSVNL